MTGTSGSQGELLVNLGTSGKDTPALLESESSPPRSPRGPHFHVRTLAAKAKLG